jgi:tetratricopeptide (TPR) repeat protein
MKKITFYLILFLTSPLFAGAINWPSSNYLTIPIAEEESAPIIIDRYFTQYPTLKKNERWREIIRLGHKAIKAATELLHHEAEAQIALQLSTSFYYLGTYSKSLEQAQKASKIANEYSYERLIIKSLCQISANHRAFAHLTQNAEEIQKHFLLSQSKALEALEVYKEKTIKDPFLNAKVFYNIAAIEADFPQWGNQNKAHQYYKKAIVIFKILSTTEELNRSYIRLARFYHQQNNPKEAQNILNRIRSKLKHHRTLIHFELLQAEIHSSQNKIEPALDTAQHALKHAKRLHARQEIIRIQSLIAEIKKNQESSEV